MKDYYVIEGFLADIYDLPQKIMPGFIEKKINRVLKLIPKNAGKILDMATGTAGIAIQVKKKFPKAEVYAIDLSNKMLKIARNKIKREKLKIALSKQNIEKTNFRNNFFDVVVISLGMHHVAPQKTRHVLSEIKRVLKNKGKIIILDIHKPKNAIVKAVYLFAVKLIEGHAIPFFEQNLVKELKEVGFKKVKRRTYNLSTIQIIKAERG